MEKRPRQNELLDQFDRELGLYRDLAATIASLLQQILPPLKVQIHSITHRCKERESFKAKIGRPEKNYRSLSDITDIAAVRITTYFADDVDSVAELIEAEFKVDSNNSTDKRRLLDPDRFGYQSLHYVAAFTDQRCSLLEYQRFSDRKFEVQVRSILQHAWAEIEHDMGYKSAQGIPRNIRRRFARIAGLLELADDEFSAIRDELAAYVATVPADITEKPDQVGINLPSLKALYASDSVVHSLDLTIAEAADGATLTPADDEMIDRTVKSLHAVGIRTIAEFEQASKINLEAVKRFAPLWLEGSRYSTLPQTVGSLYLAYLILGRSGDRAHVDAFVTQMNLSRDKFGIDIVDRIINTAKAAG